MKVDILVLNYNGKQLLEAYLSSVCRAAAYSVQQCRVWVIDNVSSDGSVEFVKKNYPEVRIYTAKQNKVLCSYNEVVAQLDSEIVIFLNNDIKVKEDFIDPLIKHFCDENVFFAAPCVLNFDGTYNGGRSHFEFKWGIIKSVVDKENSFSRGPTQMISCGAFRRKKFLELGGFDELYLPGIWEDADICYRALRRGYQGVYEPESVIWHNESTSFNKEYGKRLKLIIAHRNMFLFLWKNITNQAMLITHILVLFPYLIFAALRGKIEFLLGFYQALLKMPEVLKRRPHAIRQLSGKTVNDRELILWR